MGKMLRKLIPAGHRVLVKLQKPEEKKEVVSKSGFVLEIKSDRTLKAEKYATQEAIVMALGANAFKAFDDGKPWCKVGDLVLICKYSGEDREDIEENEIYRIINDEDIEAIFLEESN